PEDTTASPELDTMVPLARPPEAMISRLDSSCVPNATPDDHTYSTPPLETTVEMAWPPEDTDKLPPLDTTVPAAVPPERTNWLPPEITVALARPISSMYSTPPDRMTSPISVEADIK